MRTVRHLGGPFCVWTRGDAGQRFLAWQETFTSPHPPSRRRPRRRGAFWLWEAGDGPSFWQIGMWSMTFQVWLAFALASAVVVLIPGPNNVLTVIYAKTEGARSGLATVPGQVLGVFIAMTASLAGAGAGAGAILAASVCWFTAMKVAGALYLLWLRASCGQRQCQRSELKTARRIAASGGCSVNPPWSALSIPKVRSSTWLSCRSSSTPASRPSRSSCF